MQFKLKIFKAKFCRLGFLITAGLFLYSLSALSQIPPVPEKTIYLFSQPFDSSALKSFPAFRSPIALEITSDARIYLLDAGANRIYKFDNKLQVVKTTSGWGSKQDRLDHPTDLALDNGLNLFAADYQNGRIVRLDKDLNFLMEAKISSLNPDYEYPLSLALTGWGDIYILEERSGAIVQLLSGMNSVMEFGGFRPGKAASSGASRLASDERSNIYAAIPADSVIIIYDRYGNFLDKFKTIAPPEALSCENGRVWYGGKWGIACLEGKSHLRLQFLPPESKAEGIIDISVNNGFLAILTTDSPPLRIFRLSTSPAHIDW